MNARVTLPDYSVVHLQVPSGFTFACWQQHMSRYIRSPAVQYSYLDFYEDDWLDIVDEDDWSMALESMTDSDEMIPLQLRIRKIQSGKMELPPLKVVQPYFARAIMINYDTIQEAKSRNETIPIRKNFNDLFEQILNKHGKI